MFNFKALALATTLALGGMFGGLAPAEAGTCWFREGRYHNAAPEYCATERRINSNGHVVFDVTDIKGQTLTIVMWDDNTAELIGIADYVVKVPIYTDRDGDTRFVLPQGREFIVRF